MKKFLRKNLALLLCILMALSNTSMAFAEELDYTESDTSVVEADMSADSVIISGAPEAIAELGDNAVENISVTSRTIRLDAGKGTCVSESITLEDGSVLPQQLPAPTRTGWTFVGWYTNTVTENFWGDQEGETFSALEAKYNGDTEKARQKDFTWIVESTGELVEAGQPLPSNVDTLYAMYEPTNNITVTWHYNGWKKNTDKTDIFLTHLKKEYDSPVVRAELESVLPWEGHQFIGWYTAAGEDGEEWTFDKAIKDSDGSVYYISDKGVTGDLHLYAHWTGGTEPDSISLNYKNQLVEPGESVSVTASYFPLSADAPKLKWSVEGAPDVEVSQQVSEDGLKITLTIDQDADVVESNKSVTVTATSETNPNLNAQVSISVGHSWKMVSYKDPTCDQPGEKQYRCTKHNEVTKNVPLDPDGHRFVLSSRTTKEPTCVAEGSYTDIHTCYVCSVTRQVVTPIPATGIHAWNDGDITVVPTCTDSGIMTYTCSDCGDTRKESIPATGLHTWDNGEITTFPTCADSGIKTFTCADCGDTKEEIIPATGLHTWDNGEITTRPTCADSGIMTFTCSGCADTYEKTIPATEQHKYEKTSTVVDKEADCENDGLHTDIYACTVCGAEKTEQVTDPSTGEHDFYEFVNLNLGNVNHYQTCRMCGKTEFLYVEKIDSDIYVISAQAKIFNSGAAEKSTVTESAGSAETVSDQTNNPITTPSASNPYSTKAESGTKNTKENKMPANQVKNTSETGYQIQYSMDRAFKGEVITVTVSEKGSVSQTVNLLQKGKVYNVRIRAYKTISGTKYYSGWSSPMTYTF